MKFSFSKNKYRKIKAFTLLETLASMSIIAAVILGPLTVAVNSSSYARQTKDIMTVTYLAEESIELIHHQYDSLYISCLNQVAPCDSSVPNPGETVGETSWRIFKDRFFANPTCGGVGCSYDFIDMSTTTETILSKYSTADLDCKYLSLRSVPIIDLSVSGRVYVCNSVPSHQVGYSLSNPYYTRKVVMTSIPTFETIAPYYNDDIRITSTVSFKRSNGVTRDITVIDFLHARP